jgi:hypothetical protein
MSRFFSSRRIVSAATDSGTASSGCSVLMGAGGFCMCANSISIVVSALKGRSAVNIWYMTTPRE